MYYETDCKIDKCQIIPSRHRVPTDPVSYADCVRRLIKCNDKLGKMLDSDPGVQKWLRNPESGVPVSLKDIFKNL